MASGEALELLRAHVESVQTTAVGADPQHVQRIGGVGADGEHRFDGERGAVLGVVAIGLPRVGFRVEAQQALHRADPQHTIRPVVHRGGEGIGVVDHRHRPSVRRADLGGRINAPERQVAPGPQCAVLADVQRKDEAIIHLVLDPWLDQIQLARGGIVSSDDPIHEVGPISAVSGLHGHVRVLRWQLRGDRRPSISHLADDGRMVPLHRIEDREVTVVMRGEQLSVIRRGERAHAGARPVVEAFFACIVLQQAIARGAQPKRSGAVDGAPLQCTDHGAQVRIGTLDVDKLPSIRVEAV